MRTTDMGLHLTIGVYEHCMQGFFNNMISEWKKTEYKQQGRVVQSWAKITQG